MGSEIRLRIICTSNGYEYLPGGLYSPAVELCGDGVGSHLTNFHQLTRNKECVTWEVK